MQSWALGADSSGKHDIYSLGENFKQLFVRPVTHCLLFSAVKSLYCELIGSDSSGGVQLEFPQCFSSHFDEFVSERTLQKSAPLAEYNPLTVILLPHLPMPVARQ